MTTLPQALTLASPALAKKPYVQHYMHFKCTPGEVIACDDRLGIRVTGVDHALTCCAPGTPFINAFTDGAVASVSGSTLVVKRNGSTLKLPTLPAGEYPLLWPEPSENTPSILLGADGIEAIATCMAGAGKDDERPEFLGVTVIPFGAPSGSHVLASTDNITITTCIVELQRDTDTATVPFVMPDPFCRALIAACKGYKGTVLLWVSESRVHAWIGDNVEVFCSTAVTAPWDHAGMMAKLRGELRGPTSFLPTNWTEGLQQALRVLGNESHKGATFSSSANGFLVMAERGRYSADVAMESSTAPPTTMRFDPKLLLRAPKGMTCMQFGPSFLFMADAHARATYVVSASATTSKVADWSDDDIPF